MPRPRVTLLAHRTCRDELESLLGPDHIPLEHCTRRGLYRGHSGSIGGILTAAGSIGWIGIGTFSVYVYIYNGRAGVDVQSPGLA